ncbi:MAG TPA: enoyl-CoA hydratase-related protein [Blastocatellia bacterium]|nr:enoyl-CoA hydratase-related protein [Blastocatellia bacterium]
MPNNENIILEKQDRIATITLNRPEKLNAFAGRMRDELAEAIEDAGQDNAIRVVVITGAGKAFCSGADLTRTVELAKDKDSAAFRSLLEAGRRVVSDIRQMPKPVIASINGAAAGAGLNLALACDIRLASATAKFSQAFVKIGLHPDWGGTFFLPRLIGTAKSCELMFTGDAIDAATAERLGIINRAVPPEELQTATKELASKLSAAPPLAIAMMKRAIYRSAEDSLEAMLAYETEAQLACFESQDCLEGINAFLEKRAPVFKGE